jgi:hypothetical protein
MFSQVKYQIGPGPSAVHPMTGVKSVSSMVDRNKGFRQELCHIKCKQKNEKN